MLIASRILSKIANITIIEEKKLPKAEPSSIKECPESGYQASLRITAAHTAKTPNLANLGIVVRVAYQ